MKRFKNILFYTYGSGDSDPALSRAVELAQRKVTMESVQRCAMFLLRQMRRTLRPNKKLT